MPPRSLVRTLAAGGDLGLRRASTSRGFKNRHLPASTSRSQGAVAHALDLLDVMADLLEHAADLPVASFGQRDLVPGIVLLAHQIDSPAACARIA